MVKAKPFDPVFSLEILPYEGQLPKDGKFRDLEFENRTLTFDFCEEFNGCRFKKIRFIGDWTKVTFIDCLFDQCDLSNQDLSSGMFVRVRFERCKGTGSSFRKSHLKAVRIQDSVFDLSDFSESQFDQVRFLDSRFNESALMDIRQSGFITDRVDFKAADFSGTVLNGMDLSTCTLDGMRLSAEKLKGLWVNEAQAVAVAALLGVRIKAR